jgi:hypothetical protein
LLASVCGAAAGAAVDERDALTELWSGMYDMSEELIIGAGQDSPLAPLTEQSRVQINVRRIQLPWLGTHVLYVEEYPHDEPFELRRRVLLSIEPDVAADGTLHLRQFTRRADSANPATLTAADVESVPGCDLYLKREGGQFRGGTRGRGCLDSAAAQQRWLDYHVVVGDGLFWYRKRQLTLDGDEPAEEIAGFPHVDFEEARLFSCDISWAPQGAKDSSSRRKILDGVDLHDRGGRARFRTPDGRDLLLELHGRDWPLSEGRESLVLILSSAGGDSETIASSWTSLNAARVGVDIGWLAIDCAPVVPESGEQRS